MIDLDNPELQNALQIIQFTRRSLFLTGKAGTGKSTFLRYIAANTKKKHIILAPTGIAAINAGGSSNQRIINVQKSLKEGRVIELNLTTENPNPVL